MNAISSTPLLPVQSGDVSATKKPSKLHDAAQQFEALMIGEMMKSVRDSSEEGWMGSGGDSGSDSAMDMAESQFAKGLSMGGGLGLAKVIEQRMTANRPDLQK